MIIWSGLGFLVAVIVIVCALISNVAVNSIFHDPDYFEMHGWALGSALILAGVLCWFIGQKLRNQGAQMLIDPQTRQPVYLRKSHSFFFIPIQWWSGVLVPIGIIWCFAMNSTREEVQQERAERQERREDRAMARELKHASKSAPSSHNATPTAEVKSTEAATPADAPKPSE